MTKCTECLQDKKDARVTGCPYDIIEVDEVYWHRSRFNFGEPTGRCLDCNSIHGQPHHWGCAVERCPRCGYQLISCDCWAEALIGLYDRRSLTEVKDEDILPATDPVGLEKR